jgi:hypothetical protein
MGGLRRAANAICRTLQPAPVPERTILIVPRDSAQLQNSGASQAADARAWGMVLFCKQSVVILRDVLQGRFVFLPYQRREAKYDDVGPKV